MLRLTGCGWVKGRGLTPSHDGYADGNVRLRPVFGAIDERAGRNFCPIRSLDRGDDARERQLFTPVRQVISRRLYPLLRVATRCTRTETAIGRTAGAGHTLSGADTLWGSGSGQRQ